MLPDMVLQKSVDYGFVGYQVPRIPRATRSARKRGSFKKKTDDNPMRAFDLLATVAGNILLENEGSPSSSDTLVKKERESEDTCVKSSLEKVPFVSKIISGAPTSHDDIHSGLASVVTSSHGSGKIENLNSPKKRILLGCLSNKVDSCDYASHGENKEHVKAEVLKTENASIGTKVDMYSSDIRLEKDVKLQLCNKPITRDFIPVTSRDDVKLVIRDDDEKNSRCTKFGYGTKAFSPSPRAGDHRVRKLLASKYWKVTSKPIEATHYKADSEMKPAYQCRKNFYKRHRSQRDYPLKKRRLYRCSSPSNSDGENNGDSVVSLPKECSFDASNFSTKVNGGSCIAGQPTPLLSRDAHVKLKIKSFKVPELFIDIPENATVGNLKRTVLEAVTSLLGGGLRVGVLLQGKKIRDDNRTLLQTGIPHDDVLEDLGFSLEPNASQAPLAFQHEDFPSLLSCDTPQELQRRFLKKPHLIKTSIHFHQGESAGLYNPKKSYVFSDPPLLSLGSLIESDHDYAPSPSTSPDKTPMDSRSLVAAPALEAEALSMVPMKKLKRCDSAQRRIRRPFSVTEVEALVQAVEKLGTGRWRDVKIRAFDNAKHRTYVDLKSLEQLHHNNSYPEKYLEPFNNFLPNIDKWKTLVHTARISPQQRRGEPVPQDLLDRVLTAHAYWSQQQVKQQIKHHSETCLLL